MDGDRQRSTAAGFTHPLTQHVDMAALDGAVQMALNSPVYPASEDDQDPGRSGAGRSSA